MGSSGIHKSKHGIQSNKANRQIGKQYSRNQLKNASQLISPLSEFTFIPQENWQATAIQLLLHLQLEARRHNQPPRLTKGNSPTTSSTRNAMNSTKVIKSNPTHKLQHRMDNFIGEQGIPSIAVLVYIKLLQQTERKI